MDDKTIRADVAAAFVWALGAHGKTELPAVLAPSDATRFDDIFLPLWSNWLWTIAPQHVFRLPTFDLVRRRPSAMLLLADSSPWGAATDGRINPPRAGVSYPDMVPLVHLAATDDWLRLASSYLAGAAAVSDA
jgi:hypothetical protein